MDTVILNRDSSFLKDGTSMKLLWFSCLFSESVCYVSPDSFLFRIDFINDMELHKKLNYLKLLLPVYATPKLTPELFDKYVNDYFYLKKARNKSKKQILRKSLMEKFFSDIEAAYFRCMRKLQEIYNIRVLDELKNAEGNRVVFNRIPGSERPEDMFDDPAIVALMLILGKPGLVQVLDMETVKRTSVYKEGFSFTGYDGRLVISPNSVFTIPFPGELTAGQFSLARNEFMMKLKPYLDSFTDMNRDKYRFDYSSKALQDELNRIVAVYESADIMQDFIDSQAYISHLQAQGKGRPELKLHPGYISNGNMLKMYRELKIITDSMYLYIRDRAGDKVDMNACMPVMVVDTGGAD